MTEDGPRGVIATAEAAAAGETTAQARAAEAVSAIGDDAAFRAFAWLDPAALARAAAARDAARRAGAAAGPLEAVPLAVKDVIDTGDMPTGHGYAPHADRRPAEDAAVVAAARAAGALILGKTVTTELATFAPGPTRNPRDPRRTPGGSSSGSAAAVAAGMAPAALGTQTSGSV
ncbi:MAG: amidase family protein, partial [Pseudomonadota bacterium]